MNLLQNNSMPKQTVGGGESIMYLLFIQSNIITISCHGLGSLICTDSKL